MNPKTKNPERLDEESPSPTDQRTDLAFDMRDVQKDLNISFFRGKENAPVFRSLNLQESAEKQKPKLTEFIGTLVFELIPFLLYKKIPFEKIKDRSVFSDIVDLNTGNPQGAMDLMASFTKMAEIGTGDFPEGSAGKAVLDNWNAIVEKAQEVSSISTPILSGESPSKVIEKDKNGFMDRWGRPVLVSAMALGLFWGASKLVKKIWSSVTNFGVTDVGSDKSKEQAKEQPKESKNVVKTILTGFGGFALVIGLFAGLGRLVKTDTVKGWLRNLGLDDSKMVEGMRLLWDVVTGKIKLSDAWDKFKGLLDEEKPIDSVYVKIAAYVNDKISGASVLDKNIQKISDIKYRDWFPSTVGEYVSKGAGDVVIAGVQAVTSNIPLIGDFAKEDPKLKADMEIIEKFISLPENQDKINAINPGPRMTMKEVLERLCDMPKEKAKGLPDAKPVPVVGPVGAEARDVAREKHTDIEKNHQLVLKDIPENIEVVSEDIDDFIGLTESADKSMINWWQREKEYFRKVLGVVPGKGYEDADYIQLVNELMDAQETDTMIVQDLRTQASELKLKLDGLEKPISKAKLDELRTDIDDFYTNYYHFQAKLDEVNQRRISEQEKREREKVDAKWVVDKGIATAQLLGNTFFGMPYSVILRSEDNGPVVTSLGWISGGLFVTGFGKGLFQGKGLTGALTEGAKYTAKPVTMSVKYGTIYGFRLSRKAVESFQFMETSAGLLRVQRGTVSVDEAIRQAESYLDHYSLIYRENGIIQDPAAKTTLKKRVADSWRSKSITSSEREILEENLRILHKLKDAGCTTWQQGVDKGLAPTPRSVAEIFSASYSAREEALIADTVKTLKKDPVLSKDLKVGDESVLRQLAIDKLQTEGKLMPVEKMGEHVRDALKLSDAASHAERIKGLREASGQADLYFEKAISRVKQMRAAKVPDEEIEAFVKEVTGNLKTLRGNFDKNLAALKSAERTMSKVDKKDLSSFLKESAANAKGIRGLAREVKGRGKYAVVFGVANIVWETYLTTKDKKEEYVRGEIWDIVKTIGFDTFEIVLDVLCPFGITDWATVVTGKTWLTQREVSTWERVTRVVFGTYSAVSDTLAVAGAGVTAEAGGVGGGVVYGAENAIEGALRVAGKAPRLISLTKSLIPRLVALARDVGGFKNLLNIVKQEKTVSLLKGLQATKKVSGVAMKGVLGVEVGKMVYAGYEMVFDTKDQPTYEFDLEDEQLE